MACPFSQLRAGTYWLTLDNAVATVSGFAVYWDENDGPSAYAQYMTADGSSGGIAGSESFTLSGQTVPEPTTLALAGLGGVALLLRKRKQPARESSASAFKAVRNVGFIRARPNWPGSFFAHGKLRQRYEGFLLSGVTGLR